MGHSKHPGLGFSSLSPFRKQCTAEEHFLAASWAAADEAQREQVPVNVVARFLIQLAYFVRNVAVFRSCPIMPASSAPAKERLSLTTKTFSAIFPTTPYLEKF